MGTTKTHYVAIIGGAVAGSVAAEILAEHGLRVVVIEQNQRPYGKIEDGLPRWHVDQRKQEYSKIDNRLKKPGISFVPCTKLGQEVSFEDISQRWGFSAVILANGAWRDRELGLAGADKLVGKGLIYQNPFIYWYNHKNEKTYNGPRYDPPDGVLVVGGGLASIDVVKVLQLENYERALKTRGIQTDMHELEKKGIPAVCRSHGIEPETLGVKGCLLIYRRRVQDMPLAQPPDHATPEQLAKTETVRQKVLRLAREKYLFRFQDQRLPQALLVEDGRLVGLRLAETKVEGRSAIPIPGSEHELRAPMVISSIGSAPEVIPGITMNGEYYDYKDWDIGEYAGCERVFAVGNVVTGQGNIRASLVHSQHVTNKLLQQYIGVVDRNGDMDLSPLSSAAVSRAVAQAEAVKERVQSFPALPEDAITAIDQRIRTLQQKAGYDGDYDTWIRRVTPADLE